MTYQGYMALANEEGETIELVNAARVKAYTDNLAPSLGLRGCDDCEGLPEALGEEYTTPAQDNAPWYDPTDPATADFYGVYPLAFDGIDDSTRSIESAELTGDGSVVVGSRFTGKDIRVSGVAFAKDEAALDAGVSWLNSALNGTEEGRCFGDRLNLYSSCPPIEVFPPGFEVPYTLVTPPSAAELAAWTTTSGTITGDASGLRFDWTAGDPQKIACREITGLIPGEQYQLRMRMENLGDYFVRIGGSCTGERTNLAPNPRLLGWGFAGGGVADFETDVATGGPLGLGYRQSITTSSNASSPYSLTSPLAERIPVEPGTLYQASIYALAPVGTASLTATFYNSVGGAVGSPVTLLSGVAMDGTWQRLDAPVEVPSTVSIETMRIGISWALGVGAVTPNMTFGGANLLVEFPNFEVQRVNRVADARAETSAGTWPLFVGDDGAETGSFVVGAVDGPVLYGATQSPTYRRHTVTTANTTGLAGPRLNVFSPFYPDILAGRPWVSGAHFRANRSVTGTVYHRVLDSASNVIAEVSELFSLVANTWQYVSGGETPVGDLVDVQTIYTWLVLDAPLQVGDIFDATGGLVQIGSSDETYFDALRPNTPPTVYVVQELVGGEQGSAQIVVDDVGTYFDGFTEGYRWSGLPNASSSEADQEIDYQTEFGWVIEHDPPTEPTVLDFIPRSESVYLSVTPTGYPLPVASLIVEEALVRRVERPGVVAFGTGYNVVPPSDGWFHQAPPAASVTWTHGEDVQFSEVRTDARAPFAGGLVYEMPDGIYRTLFGLRPGSRYRLMIEFAEAYRETDASASVTVDPFISIPDGSGIVVTHVEGGPGSLEHFWVVEFTADGTSTSIGLQPNDPLPLGSFGSVIWQIQEYMVEEILETDATPPQAGRFQERTMYEVKASQGAILTNVRKSPCGVMAQITYALRAGNPFKYRSPIFAGGLPTGTSVAVPDVPCSEDGLPQITNFAYNPSVETNDTDWADGGVNSSASRFLSASAIVGDYVFRGTAPNTPGNRLNELAAYYNVPVSGPVPQGGEEITVSIYFRPTATAWVGTYEWTISVSVTGFPLISYNGTASALVNFEWVRIEQTFTIPEGAALDSIETHVYTPDAITQGGGFDLDGLMIQRGSVATEPFDETFPNVEWSGTPNASALLLNQVVDDISTDPDCPQPPAPPAPPQIDDSCITSPTTYNRTVVAIPADTVPRNLTAYPVITLTAGSLPVRQARIRFWENPDGLTIDQLDPCSYDGEIIVSYLADGATMVIDGVTRTATISKPGFVDQNGNHLLYGPDGGPVDWPELSGGIPYLVTLELDSGEDYSDTLMVVELVVRD